MDAALFVRQHKDIIGLLDDISQVCSKPVLTKDDAAIIRTALVSLSGKVITHLAAEDNMLYPRLLKSNNPKVSTLAREFFAEMGGMAEIFEKYLNEWMHVSAIVAQAGRFCSESEKVFSVLRERIAREEKELYVLTEHI